MSTLPADLQSPDGHAVCAHHPDQRAIAPCSRCGTFVCYQCIAHQTGTRSLCPDCSLLAPPLATRSSRFVANLVDQLVWAVGFIPLVIAEAMGASEAVELTFALGGLVVLLATLGVQFFLAFKGQSIGKKMLKIRVVRSDGSRASVARILFLRNGVPSLVNSLCGIFGIVDAVMIYSADQRCLHDHIADTIVIEA